MQSSIAWRLPFALLAAFSFLFAVASFCWLPESPRWLTLCHREADAAKAWNVLGVDSADREKVDQELQAPLAIPASERNTPLQPQSLPAEKKSSLLDAFAPDVRARTLLGVFVLGMQQMSGIDGILYVSSSPQGATPDLPLYSMLRYCFNELDSRLPAPHS
jgi:hypothetical protein